MTPKKHALPKETGTLTKKKVPLISRTALSKVHVSGGFVEFKEGPAGLIIETINGFSPSKYGASSRAMFGSSLRDACSVSPETRISFVGILHEKTSKPGNHFERHNERMKRSFAVYPSASRAKPREFHLSGFGSFSAYHDRQGFLNVRHINGFEADTLTERAIADFANQLVLKYSIEPEKIRVKEIKQTHLIHLMRGRGMPAERKVAAEVKALKLAGFGVFDAAAEKNTLFVSTVNGFPPYRYPKKELVLFISLLREKYGENFTKHVSFRGIKPKKRYPFV